MTVKNDCNCYLSDIIDSFRLGKEAQGSATLVEFIDCLTPKMSTCVSDLSQDDITIVKELLSAQAKCDYLYVADILEYIFPSSSLAKIVNT